jgi:hypothetical protein
MSCAVLLLFVSATSCNSAKNQGLAEQAVSRFHSQLDAEQYRSIYEQSDEAFRHASSEVDFVALSQKIHDKLGRVRHSDLQGSQVSWIAGQGKIVTLFYITQFAEGRAEEKFVWHLSNDHALLVGYFVNSNLLAIK